MDFSLNILDYTETKEQNRKAIESLINYLESFGVYLKISYIYEDRVLFALVNKYLNVESNIDDSLISNIEFQMELNEYRNSSRSKDMYIIIGESIPTGRNLWGEANEGFISVIKKTYEKNIWHEIAHLFGADDHYDYYTKVGTCSEQNCIMKYGKTEGVFCLETINEIRAFLNQSQLK